MSGEDESEGKQSLSYSEDFEESGKLSGPMSTITEEDRVGSSCSGVTVTESEGIRNNEDSNENEGQAEDGAGGGHEAHEDLQDLQHHFEQAPSSTTGTGGGSGGSSTSSSHELHEIMNKLDRLQRTQEMLERVLDAGSEQDAHQILAQIGGSGNTSGAKDIVEEEDKDNSGTISLSKEMDALQKLIDAEGSLTEQDQEEEEEEKDKTIHTEEEERSVDLVLKEYEEIERALASCDEQESIRSESFDKSGRNVMVSEVGGGSGREMGGGDATSGYQESILNMSATSSVSHKDKEHENSNSRLIGDLDQFLGLNQGIGEQIQNEYRTRTKTLNKIPHSAKASSSDPNVNVDRSINYRPSSAGSIKSVERRTNNLQRKELASHNKEPITRHEGPASGAGEGLHAIAHRTSENDYIVQAETIRKLEAEIVRQDSLLQAFQEDNEKLYSDLKAKEAEYKARENEWEDLVNSLKTEIATLKIQRLTPVGPPPSRPASGARRQELEKLKEETSIKSQQILELRKEIIELRNTLCEANKTQFKSPQGKAGGRQAFQEKEKEYQKQLRSLNKQVRTLQKILYSKDPSQAQTQGLSRTTSGEDVFNLSNDFASSKEDNGAQVAVLESRILELEQNLAQADEDAKERLKDFQARLNNLKNKYDEQIHEYELQLQEATSKINLLESSVSQSVIDELKDKISQGQMEIAHLKGEINRYKRDLEIAQKSTVPSHTLNKQDAGTLALALKSFKSELADKDKEIIKLKKETAELNRTNNNLKRERERYLSSAGLNVGVNPRVVSRVQSANVAVGGKELPGGGIRSTSKRGDQQRLRSQPGPGVNPNVEMLQSTLEYERSEFEQMLANKKKEIEEKDKLIQKLRTQITTDPSSFHRRDRDDDDSTNTKTLVDELRSRVTTQNELIIRLKEHVTRYRVMEEDYLRLKERCREDNARVKDLQQKLEVAKALSRPENEILAVLAQKFDELNSRYLQREHQMEAILNRLSIRTAVPSSPGGNRSAHGIAKSLLFPLSSSSSSSVSDLDLELRQLSPTLSQYLFGHSSTGNTNSNNIGTSRDLPEV